MRCHRPLHRIALCALLVVLVGGFAPGVASTPDDAVDWASFVARYNELERVDLTGIEPVLTDVDLPPDRVLSVALDWTAPRPRVVSALPDGLPMAGCVTAGAGNDGTLPWAVSPIAVAPCLHPGERYAWGLGETTMTCQGAASFCFTDGVNGLPASDPGAFVIACGLPQAYATHWSSGSTASLPLAAQCGVFGFGSLPPQWSAWDSVCASAFGAAGTYTCSHATGP